MSPSRFSPTLLPVVATCIVALASLTAMVPQRAVTRGGGSVSPLVVFPIRHVDHRDLAGTWNATYGTPGGTRPFTLILMVDGTTLTGTVRRPTEDSPLTGTVRGDSIAFSYAITYNGHPLLLGITAKVTGETMTGAVDIGGQAQEPFEATKVK